MTTLLIIIGVLETLRKNEKRLKELKIIVEITENCKASAENSMRVAIT